MVKIPVLVQDLPLTRLSNAVLVGTMKFTLDQMDLFFGAGNPAPTKLAAQLSDFRNSYTGLNAAYALTRESLLTVDIKELDDEGDQLYLGSKETVEGARRMTYVQSRKQAGDRLMVFFKKYDINVKENMISEWSKLQQMTEEANNSAQLTQDLATLGLTEMWARLTEIAVQLRDKLTERNAEMPAQQAMKNAREFIYPEYRVLIDILNSYARIDDNVARFNSLIATLNSNIDYVRIHAVKEGGSSSGNGGDNGGGDNPDNGGADNGGGDNGGGDNPTPQPDPNPNPNPDPDPDDNGGGSADE